MGKSENRQPSAQSQGDRKPGRRQNKRAEENRAIRREAIREELKAREYLRQINDIEQELKTLDDRVARLKRDARKTTMAGIAGDESRIRMELAKADARTKILKARSDLNFKRLNKVLPDLKAVELSDPDGNAPFSSFVDAVRELTQDLTLGAADLAEYDD